MSRPKPKSKNQRRRDWLRRRQNIERGMRIALHEVNEVLKPAGVQIRFPDEMIRYTVAIAEGGRANATVDDRRCALWWSAMRATARLRA